MRWVIGFTDVCRFRVSIISIAVVLAGAARWSHAQGAGDPVISTHGVRTLGVTEQDRALVATALAAGVQMARGIEVHVQLEVSEQCRGDRTCHCTVGRRSGADYVLYGEVSKLLDVYTVDARLVDARSCEVENRLFVSESVGGDLYAHIRSIGVRLGTPPVSVAQTAERGERAIDRTVLPVLVLTGKELRELGIRSLAELFRIAPGFEALELNAGTVPLVHGLDRTLLYLIDGVPALNPKRGVTMFERELDIDIESLDRVELVLAPGSVLWGHDALLGVVNFIRRGPSAREAEGRAALRVGSAGYAEVSGSVGAGNDSVRWIASGVVRASQPPSQYVADSTFVRLGLPAGELPVWGNEGFTDPDRLDRYANVYVEALVLDRLDLSVQHIAHTYFFEISPAGSLLPPGEQGSFDYAHTIYAARWRDRIVPPLAYQVSWSYYEVTAWDELVRHPSSPLGAADGSVAYQGNREEPQESQLVEAQIVHELSGEMWSHRLLAGGSYLHIRIPTNFATIGGFSAEPPPQIDFSSQLQDAVSGYATEDVGLGPFTVSAGGRVEYRREQGAIAVGQGGVAFAYGPLGCKLSLGQGYRAPLANDLYSTSGVFGQEDLRPEKIWAASAEATVSPFSLLALRAGALYGRLTDLILQDATIAPPGFQTVPVNAGEIEVFTAYGEAALSVGTRGFARAGYTFRDLDESDPTIGLAHHTGYFAGVIRPLPGVRVFARASAVSSRSVDLRIPQEDAADPATERVDIDPDVRVDGGLALEKLVGDFTAELTLSNPIGLRHDTPNAVSRTADILEQTSARQIFVTVRWEP